MHRQQQQNQLEERHVPRVIVQIKNQAPANIIVQQKCNSNNRGTCAPTEEGPNSSETGSGDSEISPKDRTGVDRVTRLQTHRQQYYLIGIWNMSPKKNKSAAGIGKEVPGIFSDIKIDVNALDGHYNKGNTISSDSYRPYTIFGEFGAPNWTKFGGGGGEWNYTSSSKGAQCCSWIQFHSDLPLWSTDFMLTSTLIPSLIRSFRDEWPDFNRKYVILKIIVVIFNYHNPYNHHHPHASHTWMFSIFTCNWRWLPGYL